MLYFKPWNVTEGEEEYGFDPVYENESDSSHGSDISVDGVVSQEHDNLANEVHPIFARIKFPGIDYETILPSLRLASLLIDTDCLLNHWHNLWFGDLLRVDHGDGEDDWHWACFPSRSILSSKDKAMVRSRLKTMASMVTFYRRKTLTGALCQPSEGQLDRVAPYTYGDFPGACSTVYYDESIVEQLSRLDSTRDCESFLRFQLSFARLMVHELAHAAHAAAWNVHEEPCGSATMGEAGYDWEANILSGIGHTYESEHAMNHIVNQWPNGRLGKKYLKEGWNIWIQDKCPDVDIGWEVPYFYVQKLFATSFWEQAVPEQGAAALKIPKLRGHLYETDDDGSMIIQRPFNVDRVSYEQSLPEDCCIDDAYEGTIRPFAPGVEYEGFGRLLRIDTDALFPPDPCSRAWQIEHPSLKTWWDTMGVKGPKGPIGNCCGELVKIE
ncbi:hypothetical protein LTR86_002119 [Recurvomyces mirabilis]|nr:hypothetical protein LTR86_002119 [Recurvomyces mirabilis]